MGAVRLVERTGRIVQNYEVDKRAFQAKKISNHKKKDLRHKVLLQPTVPWTYLPLQKFVYRFVQAIFNKHDARGKGFLSQAQLRNLLKDVGLNVETKDLKLLFGRIDHDATNHVSRYPTAFIM